MYSVLTPPTFSMFPQKDLGIGNTKIISPHSHDNYRVPQNVSPSLNVTPPATSSFPISPSSPHQLSESTTLPRSATRQTKSMQNLSLSVVSLLFNKNSGQPRPGTASSVRDEKSFGRPSSRDEHVSSSPPSRLEKPGRRRMRSSSISATLPPPLNPSGISPPTTQPHPLFNRQSKKQFSKASSMLRDNGRGRISARPVIDITTDTDALYDVEDACSSISAINFADDPDEKPRNKQSKRESVSPDDDEPITPPSFNYTFGPVLDISAANRITENEESRVEDDEYDYPTYRKSSLGSDEKILRTLSESPPSPRTRRSSSIVFKPPPSCRSSLSTSVESSSDIIWALPEVPNLSPISTTGFTLLSPQSPLPQPNEHEPSKHKRRSSVFRSVDLLSTFLKPTGHNYPRSSLFRSASVSRSTVLASSASVTQPQDPSIPPGLDIVGGGTAKLKERKKHRESVITQDSSLSDLHRLPASLTIPSITGDAYFAHSLTFNYTPSRSHHVQTSSTNTGSHSEEHRDSFSTQISTLSDLHRLPDSLRNPVQDETRSMESENTRAPLGPSTSVSLYAPASVPAQEVPILIIPSPAPRRHRPLPPLPIETSTSFPSQTPTKDDEDGEILGTGTDIEDIDLGAASDSLVSPIVFASPASAPEADDMESPFRLITGLFAGVSRIDKDPEQGSLFDSPSTSTFTSSPPSLLSPNSARRTEVRPAFGDLVWGGTTASSKAQPQRQPIANSLDHLDRLYPPARGTSLKRPRTLSTLSTAPHEQERKLSAPDTVFRALRRTRRDGSKTWVGEWNVDMPDVIKQLRILK